MTAPLICMAVINPVTMTGVVLIVVKVSDVCNIARVTAEVCGEDVLN